MSSISFHDRVRESNGEYQVAAVRRRPGVFFSLLWKDARLAAPMWTVAMLGTAGLFLLAAMLRWYLGEWVVERSAFSALWVLLPNLIALGLPAALISGENDDRTLDWLRTIPISHRIVVASKMLISLAAWLTVLVWTSLWFAISHAVFVFRDTPIITTDEIAPLIGYGLALLGCGLIAAWWVRRPIVAILVTAAMIVAVSVFANLGVRWMLVGDAFSKYPIPDPTTGQLMAIYIIAALTYATMVGICTLLGRRRFTGATDESSPQWLLSLSISRLTHGFPSGRSLASFPTNARPTARKALLWQQTRQTGWVMILAAIVCVAVCGTWLTTEDSEARGYSAGLALPAAQLLLGLMVFSGDRRHSRWLFLGERGISSNLIWWTRLRPILAVSLSISLLFALTLMITRTTSERLDPNLPDALSYMVIIAMFTLVMFMGTCLGQWFTRLPIAIFASPILVVLWFYLALWLLQSLPERTVIVWLIPSVAVFAYSTWRLTPRILEGQRGVVVWGRGLSHAAIAMGVLFVGSLFQWLITLPPAMPQWRAEMLLTSGPDYGSSEFGEMRESLDIKDSIIWWERPIVPLSRVDVAELQNKLSKELDEQNEIGRHIAMEQVVTLLLYDDDSQDANRFPESVDRNTIEQMQLESIEIALKWANAIRYEASWRHSSLYQLLEVAEPLERFAVQALTNFAFRHDYEHHPTGEQTTVEPTKQAKRFANLVRQIPSSERRRRSRRQSLIHEYQQFHQQLQWDHPSKVHRSLPFFAGFSIVTRLDPLGFDRIRAVRHLDIAVRLTLRSLERGLPRWSTAEHEELIEAWRKVFPGGRSARIGGLTGEEFPVFTINSEEEISELRNIAGTLLGND
ncbi:ABC transporter permease [Neorhodopirellula pilleata]|uniref:ABC-2 family transporter protein n=1 Tax=Neorhodopirellula pilleata TaxID=2714738 RepID=A0A5C5ZPV2_9BACT|nr:ABC transporter permease [Neorhodopirellula pilleata]TWT89216.1 ABC-2 family transporter protein [Neorhodopirellula pilleata]